MILRKESLLQPSVVELRSLTRSALILITIPTELSLPLKDKHQKTIVCSDSLEVYCVEPFRACCILHTGNVIERGDNIIEKVYIKFYVKLTLIFSFLLYFRYET